MRLLNFCNKVIEYSFYLLFFLVPLAFTSDTSELFEFNKLWVTFIISVVIAFAWATKMVVKKEFRIQRTPLDIPIGIFLVSEIISTVLSLDTHTSLWGYYSRFNGGLFSIISYIFLYYAFVTNFKDENEEKGAFDFKKIYIFILGIVLFFTGAFISSLIKTPGIAGLPFQMLATLITVVFSFAVFMKASPNGVFKKSLYAIFSSAILVVLWGLPSHFGFDPTCLLFRGTLDVSCWTADFQPKIRIFSTMGQPDWLAAYLAALLPVIVAIFMKFLLSVKLWEKKNPLFKNRKLFISVAYLVMFVAFYVALLFTQSRSAILAFWLILPAMLFYYFWFHIKPSLNAKKYGLDFKLVIALLLTTAVVTFFAGQPFQQLSKLTLNGIKSNFAKPQVTKTIPRETPSTPVSNAELGGTDSGKIRLLVWEGAITIWKANPIFGSGLETYAFAYYKHRPAAHNLTSEWQYLYNKAHNEYLNYLATTGTVGIITYLSMIGTFLVVSLKHLYEKRKKPSHNEFLAIALLGGYVAILITNFFGFSVVMINILFYLTPAFVFMLLGLLNYEKAYSFSFSKKESYVLNTVQKASIGIIAIIFLYVIYVLINFWNADRYYYFGLNFDRTGDYQKAYSFLKAAVDKRPSEPTFRDEFAYNNAVLGAAILVQSEKQKDQQQNLQIAKQLIQTAVDTTNQVTSEHPNNIVFTKTKVRVFYTLGQIDPSYLPLALDAIKKASSLAPTDADVSYNLGVLYGQMGDAKNAVKTLENTIKLKPDYSKAYYALGIFYHQLAVDQKGTVINQEYNQKAIDEMKLLIKLFGPNKQAQDAINLWSGGTPRSR